MTLARTCDACQKQIVQHGLRFLQIRILVLRIEGDDKQEALEEMLGDYCDECAGNGLAIKDLLAGFKKCPQEKALNIAHVTRAAALGWRPQAPDTTETKE